MKPRNAQQRKVMELSRRLNPITDKQVQWAYAHCLEHIAYRTAKNMLTCGDCGHTWKSESTLGDTLCGCTCPNCGKTLEVKDTRKRTFRQCCYFCVVTVCKGCQVIRIVMVKADSRKGNAMTFFSKEVAQRWIMPDGKVITVARLRGLGFTYKDLWIFESEMEVRPHHAIYDIISHCEHYPKVRVLPIFRLTGFKGSFHNATPFRFLHSLLTDSKVETLLKAKQYAVLSRFIHTYDMKRKWNSLKICIRNNYMIKDAVMWNDYIELLEIYHKDTRNAKYVCPTDLKAEHDRLSARRERELERIREKNEREREIAEKEAKIREEERLRKDELLYAEMKGRFLDLAFSDGMINLHVLQNVQEFYEEGKAMNHCVFTNGYYKKENVLVFSARIGEKRIETVELSLETMQVVQSYGIYNSITEYHEQIIRLVKENVRDIQKRMVA